MKTLKSLQEVMEITPDDVQVNAQDIINGRLYTDNGWESFNISKDLREDLAHNLIELLGGREKDKSRILSVILRGRPQHWGLERLIFFNTNNGDLPKPLIRCRYIAGQDYTYEVNEIRKYLRIG